MANNNQTQSSVCGERGRGRLSNPLIFASETTPVGEQTLVYGISPITTRERIAMRACAPLEPKRAQRPANHGLFDLGARNQIEMF